MKKQYRSDAFAAIHETASDLHEAGARDIRTLRKFEIVLHMGSDHPNYLFPFSLYAACTCNFPLKSCFEA